jgi:hypothetical protein
VSGLSVEVVLAVLHTFLLPFRPVTKSESGLRQALPYLFVSVQGRCFFYG